MPMQPLLSVFALTLFATLSFSGPASAGTTRAARAVRAPLGALRTRPAVVENGSDLALFNFTGGIARAVAFAPDGSSYSIVRSGILKVAPDGSATFLVDFDHTVPNDYQNIVYADGFLWFGVYHGIVRMRLDGSGHRFFQFNYNMTGITSAQNMVAGGDGLYFNTASTIGRIGYSDFKLTLFPASSVGQSFIWSPDGHLDYITSTLIYVAKPTAHYVRRTSFSQIQPDGTTKVLGTASGCGNRANLVVSLGAIYYTGTQYDTNGNPIGETLCRATLSGKISAITSIVAPLSYGTGEIAADNSANLWTIGLFGNGLYSYNIVSKQLAGAYEPNVLNDLDPFRIYVGPDQNVWFFGYRPVTQLFYGAYVRHQQVLTPTALALNAVTTTAEFFVSETLRSGPWTAVSLDPAVATVTPASSLVGRFHVTKAAAGTTSIVITDAYGNVSYLPVSAN